MNNNVTNLLIFVTGVAIGSVVTWQLVKKEYEQIAQAEIDSVKEAFANTAVNDAPLVQEEDEDYVTDDETEEYYDILEEQGYIEAPDPNPQHPRDQVPAEPYVISPDEFQEDHGYTEITFYHLADGVLVDENYEIVEDVANSVGLDYADHYGEYEDDAVHVRNDRLRCEYEILLDLRTYDEIAKTKPHRVEV